MNYTCKDSPNEFDDLTPTEKSTLLNWISQNLIKIKSINNKHSSYFLKKLFEIKSKYEQNWYFNISEKSIKKLKSNQ